MATNKNITMKQFNGVDYDTLYPKTIAAQIDDVYSKDEMSNLFLPKAGGSMGGILDMNGNRITNLPTPTSNSDPATKEYVDRNIGEKVYDYFSDFNIPKTIDNCYIGSTIARYGTATVTNYIGYSVVNVNVKTASSNVSYPLIKSNGEAVMPGYIGSNQSNTSIYSGTTNMRAFTNGDKVNIPISRAGYSKYLFPFNLI